MNKSMLSRSALFNYCYFFFILCSFIFLYAPIVVLIIFSFNSIAFPYKWVSFSTRWYQELFQSIEIWDATKNSLIVACSTVLLSLSLGVSFIFYSAVKRLQSLQTFFYLNLLVPEIVLALGLLNLFSFFQVPLGLRTLIAGHTVLGLGYVIPILSARFSEIEPTMIEASLDLGATLNQTFFKIILPMLRPALFAAGLLVFIVSLDDFLISFFCAGSSAQTLSLYIFAMIRIGVSPVVNALSTILLLVSSLVVLIFSLLKVKTKIF